MRPEIGSENVMKHADFETLVGYAEGSLPDADRPQVAGHLSVCASCRSEVTKLAQFFRFAETGELETVPQATTAHLLNIYRRKKVAPKTAAKISLLANLVFDDWNFALNERFVMSDLRQLLYRAGTFEIDLRLNFSGEKCNVDGQVFPDCTGGTAELIGRTATHRVALDADCEFALPRVECGVYDLKFDIDGVTIEIKDMPLTLDN